MRSDLVFHALYRRFPQVERRFYLSSGIHEDETAGPLAIRALLQQDDFHDDAECWLLPCLNPTGFAKNRRENVAGIDLNRDYRKPKSEEFRAHLAWPKDKRRLNCAVCLHEGWEAQGFYLYAVTPQAFDWVSGSIIAAVSRVFPIEASNGTEGFPALWRNYSPASESNGLSGVPESLYLAQHHCGLGYTLETSSDFPLDVRVNALAAEVRAVWASVA
ncbi:MAG: hypothetical protein M2R45_03837 [Verrucomicrobia subdivision 3 bacterium]|nr:hypothetical protein [Limisphaerales bacterium]MCS1415793.1 hypothetical protein [Limisphaerales bacterium]